MHFGKGAWGDAKDASIMFVSRSIPRIKPNASLLLLESQQARNGIVSQETGSGLITRHTMSFLPVFRTEHDRILSQIQLFLVDEVSH